MEVEFKQELLSMCENEVEPLAYDEWEESGHPDNSLDIDWDQYFLLEGHSRLKFFTARINGDLVGYFVVILVSPLTARGELIAAYDSVYVTPEYRKSSVGKRLFTFVEGCMKEDGIHRVIASSSKKNPIGNFLNRLGYREIETKYEKVL